ncbi:IS110 family transposase [Pelomonas sp. CA6]|uniref:IS110 family transposase n=1 Tax=Pelomonas sp. CA6 TaxID=2907999 RepID=UPI001F4BD08E|nr:IS110 family transposase [Pelomonas sp. CA6]MCH7345276.1 IS110 family transposase [Pelomonas sp. CA6]
MDKSTPLTPRLQMLGERLREAAAARNWQALARSDAELAQLLSGLNPVRLSPGERGALRQLERLHLQLRQDCARESERIAGVLAQMQMQRPAWNAYAESQSWSAEAGA